MVTQFNRKDLVSFANYVLDLINTGKKEQDPSGLYETTHSNVENWLHFKDTEDGLLKSINSMCEESLNPEVFEKWAEVKEMLMQTRKDL